MDATDRGAKEPPFVGDERRELVDRLLADFDQLSESGTPRWWSLEGHSGWGKTRIVQEFYRRLAAERQAGLPYWPPSLTPDVPLAKRIGLATSMRKRVYPEQVVREPDAVPTWFWWGIACAVRSGTPVQALADDLTQFTQHQVGLQRRWGQLVSPAARIGARLSSKKGEIIDTAVGEGLSAAASLASVAIPLLGVIVLAAKWGVQGLRDSHSAAGTPVVDATGGGRADLVDELAPALERLAAAGLPIVITVEDLHLADESLVELLARLLAAQGARVLVISTAWRGLLDEDSRPAHRLLERVAPERVHRVLAEDDLPDLGLNERQEIVSATLPGVSAWNASLLAASYTNPWALQLACNVGWVRRATRDLTAEEVARLPRDVEGLFTQLWKELPEDTRTMLMVAALSTPAGISDSMGFGDARWESSLLAAVSGTEAWGRASTGDLADALGQSSDAYAWIRVVDEWLRRFHDPGQNDVAVGHAKIEYDDSERRLMYEAMARRMSTGVAESPTQQLHQARLLVALASEGFLAWDQTTMAGAVTLCTSLLAAPDVDSRRHVILIAENALRSLSAEPAAAGPLLTLRGQYGSALAESGRVADAIRVFEELLADQRRLLEPDALDTLITRHNRAESLAKSGRVDEAITAFEELLVDEARVLESDAAQTLMTRHSLAESLARSGRIDAAIAVFEELLLDESRVLGPDAPATLESRHRRAWLLARSGRIDPAIAEFEQVLADRIRVLGSEDPSALNTRHNIAWWLGKSGRVDQA
ncbi:MAG TPA: tetratricopeptide repeat protein, partial [Burkholderiaceae bacterium]